MISGYRIGLGGMSEHLGITPDLVTYGKVIGGGLPVGAVAGPKSIMENLSPVGEVYQAGTLSANPLAMVGGLATLKKLTPETYLEMNDATEKIKELFEKWLAEFKDGIFSHYQVKTYGTLFWLVPTTKVIKNVNEIPEGLSEQFAPLFCELLNRGIYLSPNAYEVGFVSLAHNSDVISKLKKRLFD